MKALILALALGTALVTSAQAADVYRGSTKDGPDTDIPDSPLLFVGLGVGIHGGGQFTNIDLYDEFDGIGADGLVGGLHGEYLFAVGRFRVGPYVEGGFSNVNTEYGGADLLTQDTYFGGGLKAGAVLGTAFLYGRIGYEWSQWSSDFFSGDIDVDGFLIGGGVEAMIARNISIGLDAAYLIPSNVEVDGFDVTDAVEESETLRILARITYRQ